jgi:hypothetical protein
VVLDEDLAKLYLVRVIARQKQIFGRLLDDAKEELAFLVSGIEVQKLLTSKILRQNIFWLRSEHCYYLRRLDWINPEVVLERERLITNLQELLGISLSSQLVSMPCVHSD